MLPALATSTALSPTILSDGDPTSIQFRVIQLLNGILHVRR